MGVMPSNLELLIVPILGIVSTGMLCLASFDWLHARDGMVAEDAA